MNKCAFEGCEREKSEKAGFGLCVVHYGQRRSRKGMSLTPHRRAKIAAGSLCSFIGCGKPERSAGFCGGHFQQHRKGGPLKPLAQKIPRPATCTVPGCERKHSGVGYCRYHFEVWNVHKLDPVEYERMFVAQGNVCKICGNACTTNRRLAVDHDHETGKVRGLLCHRCNRGLGFFCDDTGLLLKAFTYLSAHKPALKKVS